MQSPWSTFAVQTASDPQTFVSLASYLNDNNQPCTSMQIVNAPVALDVRRAGASAFLQIAAGSSLPFDCLSNLNEVEVRPTSLTGQVTVRGFWQDEHIGRPS